MSSGTPTLGQTQTPAGGTARQKKRKTKTGRAHSHVPASRWTSPTARKSATSLPPLAYDRGPFSISVQGYDWRFWLIRGDESNTVLMREIETVTWDDASAVLTGSVTFRSPTWGEKLGVRPGHEVRAEYSEDGGMNFKPLWTMRLDQPNSDLMAHEDTMILVSDLNRLAQSDDNFQYAKGRRRPNGWRVDQIIRDIAKRYGITVAYCPKMKAYVKNWHLVNQAPLDVIHSALIREKNVTGRRYTVSMDWRKRLWITPFKRPTYLLEIGPQLVAATGSNQHDPRFATEVTVRTGYSVATHTDAKGHRKKTTKKLAVAVSSPSGIKLYGKIHRNVYSPDAESNAKARQEGKLFLAAVAKVKRSFSMTLPGIPWMRRLDAFRVHIPSEGISQLVYVSEAQHSLDASSGYTVETTLDFDDPFATDKTQKILNKLSDTAILRSRKSPTPTTKTTKISQTNQAHRAKPAKTATLGRTTTRATRK